MKRQFDVLKGCFLMITACAVASGCGGSQPSRFYLIHSVAAGEILPGQTACRPDLSLGIGPVSLPEYLDRPQIITRTGRNELVLAEFDRWAEPLSDSFTRVLAENLSRMLGTDRVFIYPWPRTTQVDCQVAVEVNHFEGFPGGRAQLSAWWTIYGDNEKTILMRKQSEIAEPVGSGSPEDLVAAQSRVLAAFSREIALAIKEHR